MERKYIFLKKADQRIWSKNYIVLMLSNFFLFFGDNLLLPVLPVHIKNLGGGEFHIGAIMATFFISSILMRILTQRMSNVLGRKKLLIIGIIIFTFSMMGYAFATMIIILFTIRFVQGTGFGISTTLCGAMVADSLPEKRMGEGMGYYGLGITIAAAAGPFLGAAVSVTNDFKWIFFVSAAVLCISIVFNILIKEDKINSGSVKEKIKGFNAVVSEFLEPKVILMSVLMMLMGITMGGVFTYLVLYGKSVGFAGMAVFFLITSIAEIIVRIFSGRLYDSRGANYVIIPGAIAGVIGLLLLGFKVDFLIIIFAGVFYGIGIGMLFPCLEAWAMKSVNSERRVAANATLYNFLDIGNGLGALFCGVLVHIIGYSNMYIFCSFAFLLLLLIYIGYIFLINKKTKKELIYEKE